MDITKQFKFRKKNYDYFDHSGNQTRVNERRVELPIAFEFVSKYYPDIIEVGNVTRHYHREWLHDVIDLYEKPAWPIWNEDILTFKPPRKYNAIVSISTVEHTADPVKAIKNIISLAPHFLITYPLGREVEAILDLGVPAYYMKRIDKDNLWKQVYDKNLIKSVKYNDPYLYGNGICILTND